MPNQHHPTKISEREKFLSRVGQIYDNSHLTLNEALHVGHSFGLDVVVSNFIALARKEGVARNGHVYSEFHYSEKYKGPKPIDEQINTLAQICGLDPSHALQYVARLPDLPRVAEGWFAVLSDEIADVHFPHIQASEDKYCASISYVFEKIGLSRSFFNQRDGLIISQNIKRLDHTREGEAVLSKAQHGPIRIIAAQLGLRHRGRSSDKVREITSAHPDQGEYGLNILMGASIALTHPCRFSSPNELTMDLPGDNFFDRRAGSQNLVPYLQLQSGGPLKFGTACSDFVLPGSGSATFFVEW